MPVLFQPRARTSKEHLELLLLVLVLVFFRVVVDDAGCCLPFVVVARFSTPYGLV